MLSYIRRTSKYRPYFALFHMVRNFTPLHNAFTPKTDIVALNHCITANFGVIKNIPWLNRFFAIRTFDFAVSWIKNINHIISHHGSFWPSFEFETIINFLKIPIISEERNVDPESFLVQRVDRQIFWNCTLG